MTSWRERIAVALGPGLLPGVTYGDWLRMLRVNRFAIHPRYWMRASVITQYSLMNSVIAWQERRRFGEEVENQIVQPPLFILGHWRSGTTHLHNLLSLDDRFAFPNAFQVAFPNTFLSTEGGGNYKLLQFFMPRKRPMDNMQLDLTVPWEDEYATCTASATSSYMGPVFPKRLEHYDRYMTFRGVPTEEVARWQASLILLLKKLTFKYRRPLILKSPPHTGRIRLLLEMFPNAKFIHIHRHPIDVFQSTRHQTDVMLRWYELQRFPRDKIDDWIFQRYREMYDAFFEERSLVPAGCFHEVGFDELESNPITTMGSIYDALNLPAFDQIEPKLRDYSAGQAGYRKNVFAELPRALRDRVTIDWQRAFAEWGYPRESRGI